MAGRGCGCGYGNQTYQAEMDEMRGRVLQALQRQEHAEARMEIPVCRRRPFDKLESSQKDEEEYV
ncbi:hypothetical protein C1H46_025014 [Malus baccata]|uniref:Uncharacterized protein n=1 Tax=Malus baccata TaxID=106549 RepID=A0A540LT55_MALBA|nr:hypothetical protein C1H46_025014 [Malus baccata]